mmetsp:Transcript_1822/g.4665  ORF Transcript_1822/g.4665 Transcript_1822/m.4665 type:complete len:381 (+) Transcript_1822:43-1185(+)
MDVAQSPARNTRMAIRSSPAVNGSIRSSPRINRRATKLDTESPQSAERTPLPQNAALEAGAPSAPASPCVAPLSPRTAAARKPPTPRDARLYVRDNRKEAIATMPALDFVSLSVCDREMVQECDDGHAQTEARKRYICTAGVNAGTKKRRRSMELGPSKSPALWSEDPSSDELVGFELRAIKLPKQRDPVRPRSSRGADSRCGDSPRGGESPRGGDSLFDGDGSSPRPRLPLAAPPLLRSLRSLHGQPGGPEVRLRPPSCAPSSRPASRAGSIGGSLFGHCPASVGLGRTVSMLDLVALNPMQRSLSRSSFVGSISGLSTMSYNLTSRPSRTSTETPPCSADAFEAHAMLVQCPAPRRPSAHSRLSHDPRLLESTLSLDF